MSSKIINVVLIFLFSFVIAKNANAGLIVGDFYSDNAGIQWEYVGSFDLAAGENYINKPTTYNGIEATEYLFGALTDNSQYALSSNNFEEFLFFNDSIAGFVNHMAWYDSFGTNGQLNEFSEYLLTENAGDVGYDAVGDYSAYVNDRANENIFLNHVFKSTTASVVISVPEPSTLAIFSLAFIGLIARRLKNQ